MSTPSAPLVCLLSHTHWDREWYQPAGRFRQRLVALVDELLEAPGDAPFLLDGQSIALEDYLDVRPERRAALAAALRAGSLEAGPWYVLADELIPGAEALVRNLLEGRRQLAALGAVPPRALYCPDSFGHPAALPELAAGFGCDVIVLWRGYGGACWPAGDAAWWRSAGGAAALLFHLPPDGYELGSSLPVDGAEARARWKRLRAVLEPRSRLGVLLVQNGADHHARQRDLGAATAALAAAAAPLEVRALSLGALGDELASRATGVPLPEVRGELRDSYGYTWALQGTFATRAQQKRRNAAVERLLTREVEPLTALAYATAAPAERARAAALVDAAWRTLLRCHPHDTLCGCSTDEVARAMDARLDDAASQAAGLRDDALARLIGWDAAAARDHADDWRSSLVLVNALPFERGGIAELEIVTPLEVVRVGPSSAGTAAAADVPDEPRFARLRDVGGVPVQVLSRRVVHQRLESPLHYPSDTLALVERAVALVPPLGGFGTSVTALAGANRAPSATARGVVRRGRRVGNSSIAVHVGRSGRVSLGADDGGPVAGFDVHDLIRIESETDAGDLYTPSIRGTPVAASFDGARVCVDGPLRTSVELRYRLTRARAANVARRVEIPLAVTLTVDAGSDLLGVEVRGRNVARDHRLRIDFASGVRDATVVADAAFGPVVRPRIDVPESDAVAERPPRTAPLHRYVSLYGAGRGFTVVSDGLAEYEAADEGTLWVTLVRAVGELSRPDLPERPGHAGWPTPTPGAQCIGAFGARFWLLMHGRDRDEERTLVERRASEALTPLRGVTLRAAGFTNAPDRRGGVELLGDGLALTALKAGGPAGEWTVARCVNVSDAAVDGVWSLGAPPREALLARLDESPLLPLAPLAVDGTLVRFHAGPRAVVTVIYR